MALVSPYEVWWCRRTLWDCAGLVSGVDCVALGLGWHWGRHMKSGDADGYLGTVLALVSALRML